MALILFVGSRAKGKINDLLVGTGPVADSPGSSESEGPLMRLLISHVGCREGQTVASVVLVAVRVRSY